MKEHTVYARQRPHLQSLLEKVAEMFEVIIFTASQSIYAEQLVDILDPDQKFISRIFSDGNYTKDLTVLGVDLAKVSIIDNSPQRFAIPVVAIQNAEIYVFDEPLSYLDVKQRLKAAHVFDFFACRIAIFLAVFVLLKI